MAVKLYHFTSKRHFQEILDSGVLKVSPSNLVKPKNLHFDKTLDRWDWDTYDYKPVVWLTESPTARDEVMQATGKEGSGERKDEVRIAAEKTPGMQKWTKWAEANGIDRKWFKDVKRASRDHQAWYVSEIPIPVEDFAAVEIDGEPFHAEGYRW